MAEQTRERKVQYGVRRHGPEIPARATGGGGGAGGNKVFAPLLEEVRNVVEAEPDASKEYFGIADYENGSAAIAAANVLRQQLGDNIGVGGWDVAPRRTNGGKTMTLFVRFDPGAVVKGERAKWEQREAARKAEIEKARKEREAVKAGQTPREQRTGPSGQSEHESAKVPAGSKTA